MLNKKGKIAISQIIILVIGIVAIGYVVGSEMEVVSGLTAAEWEAQKEAALSKGTPLPPVAGGTTPIPAIKPSSWLSEKLGIKSAPKTQTGGPTFLQAGGGADAIASGAQYALVAYYVVGLLGKMIWKNETAKIEAAQYAAAWGAGIGKTAYVLLGKGGTWQWGSGMGGWGAIGIGAAVAVYVYYERYEEITTGTFSFTCYAWDAPVGGNYCVECNKQGLPCSEYQCRSLGQACQLLNPGTDEEKCVWVNRNDIKPPVIKPRENALLDYYTYRLQNTGISPPDRGVVIEYTPNTDKCVPAFTPFSFGVTLNEPAKCKIDYLRKDAFDNMTFYFGESSLLKYNHTQIMSLPGPSAAEAENLTIRNDGNFELYVRCQDANGNSNTANFVFKYCMDPGPDTTPPLIVSTNLLNNMPIAFDQSSIDLDIYTNEPADCKWDYLDKAYDNMNNTFTCSKNIFQMNAQMLYPCSTTLTGLKNEFENKFYFRCKDLSENVNSESQPKEGFVLLGTRPLVIDSVSPNEETIKDSTDVVQVTLEVETSAGYKDGESACYLSETGEEDSYVMFGNTNSYQHSQELWFNAGSYEYFIKCLDLGGNTDEKTINFDVETDSLSPLVVRVYHEDKYLKLLTNEEAECVYDTTSCSYTFEDGIKMNNIDEISHYTDWDTALNFYIKCKDSYGNKPFPDKCNIIAKPSQIF